MVPMMTTVETVRSMTDAELTYAARDISETLIALAGADGFPPRDVLDKYLPQLALVEAEREDRRAEAELRAIGDALRAEYPGYVDVSTIHEMGLSQKLTNPIRCF
jgi:hypothetical protein